MNETAQYARPREPLQVRTGLAKLDRLALHRADPETAPHECVQVDASGGDVSA